MNAGSAQLYTNEDDIKNAIQGFAHALTDQDYGKIFSLYPSSEFEEDVASYNAEKGKLDPEVSVHSFVHHASSAIFCLHVLQSSLAMRWPGSPEH